MLWLIGVVALAVLATIPFFRSGQDERRRRFGDRVLLALWLLVTLALCAYVSFSKVVGCWREDSVLGRESWAALPFGQTCRFDSTEWRAAEVVRPGWMPTICLAVVVAGAADLVRRARIRKNP